MKNNKFFSTLFMLIIVISIPAAVFILKSQNLDFRFSALDSNIPDHVVISDVRGDAFTVNWVTEKSVVGGVKLKGDTNLPKFEEKETTYHKVEITNLNTNTPYEFTIYSEGTEFLNDSKYYTVNTASKKFSDQKNYFVYGQVFSIDGKTFQQEGQITIQFKKENNTSQILSANINEAGGYQFNLKGLLDDKFQNRFTYTGDSDVILTVYTDTSEDPVSKTFTVNVDYTRQLPNVYMGDPNVNLMPGVEGQ